MAMFKKKENETAEESDARLAAQREYMREWRKRHPGYQKKYDRPYIRKSTEELAEIRRLAALKRRKYHTDEERREAARAASRRSYAKRRDFARANPDHPRSVAYMESLRRAARKYYRKHKSAAARRNRKADKVSVTS